MDAMSPYYIHASDSPGHMHVGEPLNESNYNEWVNDMRDVLFAKNKIGFVDGTIAKPPADSTDLNHWMRCDAMVKGWLKSAMNKELRSTVRYSKTAQDIWVELKERFGKSSAPRAYELRRAVSHTRQDKQSVPVYFTKLKKSWDEIDSITPWPKCSCGGCKCDLHKQLLEMKERERLYEFLMGLDDVYATIKTHILSMNPLPKLGTAYHLVAEDEQQKLISATQSPSLEVAAFQVHHDRKKEKPRCAHCNKLGHTQEKCYDLVGYPSDWKKTGRDRRDRRGTPRAAQVSEGESPVPGLSLDQYTALMQQLNLQIKATKSSNDQPIANMAGLEFEDRDWCG
ncbi:uncharacterized protein LOC114743158 [Neltuma alba]|uniref:uncharacterized protein LOC114743158 n=1 Tax=Neltuma alba TaxID=207710 RepID=UPI0010A45FE7|nr:uncharacterized protein LOC114743158 [Prosopis alba]